MRAEKLINKIFAYAFLILGAGALAGAIFGGAYWHFFTAILCGGFSTIYFKTNKK